MPPFPAPVAVAFELDGLLLVLAVFAAVLSLALGLALDSVLVLALALALLLVLDLAILECKESVLNIHGNGLVRRVAPAVFVLEVKHGGLAHGIVSAVPVGVHVEMFSQHLEQ